MSPTFFRRVLYQITEPRAIWRLCLFLILILPLLYGGNFATRQFLQGAGPAVLFFAREIRIFLTYLCVTWVMGRIEGRSIAEYGLPWRSICRSRFWEGVLLGFVSLTGLILALRLIGAFHFGGVALRGAEIWKWALLYVLVFFLVALTEEFSARGYMLYTLSASIGFWPAAILTSVYFGYSHHGNSGEDWVGLFNAGFFGLLACLLLRRTGNLWMPIGLHMAWDWAETFFFGVANSGRTYPGQLMNTSSSGPAWLSGGAVGPEGSVLCTLLMVLAWFLCSTCLPEVKYPKPTATNVQSAERGKVSLLP